MPGPQVKCAGVSGWIGFAFLPCSLWNTIAVSRKPEVPALRSSSRRSPATSTGGSRSDPARRSGWRPSRRRWTDRGSTRCRRRPSRAGGRRASGRCRPRWPASCPDPSRRRGSRSPRSSPGRRRRRCATPRRRRPGTRSPGRSSVRCRARGRGAGPDVEVVGAVAAPDVVVPEPPQPASTRSWAIGAGALPFAEIVVGVVAEPDPVVAGIAVREVLARAGVDRVVRVATERDVVADTGGGRLRLVEGVQGDLALEHAGVVERGAEERLRRSHEPVQRRIGDRVGGRPAERSSTILPMSPTIASSSSLPSSQSLPSRP